MNFILGAIFGVGLSLLVTGALITPRTQIELGNAYGCGALAATRDAVHKLNPGVVFLDEREWCAAYRQLWEAK
jgi:hypothetical protein